MPPSLHASLLARLDNVGSAKEIAQIGAAIGREFPYEFLAAACNHTDVNPQSALDRLIEAGLLFVRGVPPHATYIQAAEQTEERWANAELWRLRGALALAARGAAGAGEAAEYFRRAIDVAGQQESRMLGLRVASNLARLLADEGRIEEAREMLINALRPICGGADTPDPKEAHDLLRKWTSDLVRAP